MAAKIIPPEVRQAVQDIVDLFNSKQLSRFDMAYSVRFRGRYAYFDRDDGYGPEPICRLTYTGHINSWEFAIYKYSAGSYDPEEFWFPGAELVDGTVAGALKAGMAAYE